MSIVPVHLCFLMDCTGSMQAWIHAAKEQIHEMIALTQLEFPHTEFRVAFVGYRDYGDRQQHVVFRFTSDIRYLCLRISDIQAEGGNDVAEDVAGGLQIVLNMFHDIPAAGVRQVIHIADAPAHGMAFHDAAVSDRYPRGDPNGIDPMRSMNILGRRGIDYTFVKINPSTDTMITAFHNAWTADAGFRVIDLQPPQRMREEDDDMVPGGEPMRLAHTISATVSESIRQYSASLDS